MPWSGQASTGGGGTWVDASSARSSTIATQGSTKLSRRIGWLNNNAGLAMQIKYSEVKDLMDQLGEAGALKLLKEVEEKKDKIRDPTAYLKTAAKRAVGGSALEAPGNMAAFPGTYPGAYAAAAYEGDAYMGEHYSPEAYASEAYAPDAYSPEPCPSSSCLEGSEVERRVGWLNANVQLQEQLMWEKVGPLLAQVGEHEAMNILKKLEDHSAEVRDPTGWVITAARRAGTMQPLVDGTGTALAALYPNSPVKGVIRTIPPSRAAAVAGSAVLVNQLKKRIGWLNANVAMKEQIVFDKVGSLLAAVGYRQAMEILKHMEEKAPTINDPTAYVANAARRAAAGGGALAPGAGLGHLALANGSTSTIDQAAAEEKLRKRITWLNSNVTLATSLNYDKVAGALLGIDSHDAMSVLKKLEENAVSVRDPDSWVITAAARRAADGSSAGAMAGATAGTGVVGILPAALPPPGGMVGAPAEAFATWDGIADEKIRKRVGWLNRNVQFAADLKYDRVGPVLQPLGASVAMEILKSLEENAGTVRDPTAYVVSAATRRLGAVPGPGNLAGAPAMGYKPGSQIIGEDDQRLRKRIGWLNRNVSFTQELRYDQASVALQGLPTVRAMEILKTLEENAASIPDPTAYVVASAQDSTPASSSGASADMPVEPATPEEKLRRRVDWMNKHLFLTEPLAYDRLAGDLLALDLRQAMEILKKLEENVSSVRDPHSWVTSAATRANQPGGGGGGEASIPSAAPSQGDPMERLRKRLSWMNTNVGLSTPLDFDLLAPCLMRLEVSQAMAVLKKLEESASTILDPNTYVTTAVDSLMAGGSSVTQGGDSALDDALRKRVSWMNANVPLAVPLVYEQISSALLALGDRAKAMEVLKKLETNAIEVQDPNEYVYNMATAYLAV